MRRELRPFLVAASVLALLAAVFASGGFAKSAGSPFYAVPPPKTRQCNGVKACLLVVGPWVVVPAHSEATFLLDCPKRHGSVGGNDAEVSSKHVHVWFDAQIGGPVTQGITTGPFLVFHAVTDNGQPGSFEPLLGCITLQNPSTIRSTVSARIASPLPGTMSGVPLDPRGKLVVLDGGSTQKKSEGCARAGERLIGSWTALAFVTSERNSIVALLTPPPDLSDIGLVTTKTAIVGHKVRATIKTGRGLPFVPLAEVQVGAICVP